MTAVHARAPWAAPVVSGLLLAVTGAARVALDLDAGRHLVSDVLPNVVLGLLLPVLGALVLTRRPGHPLGWLWVATGVVAATVLAVRTFAEVAVPRDLPLAAPAAWVSSWLWVLGATPLLALGLLLFPDGRLPSRRWRPLLVLAALAVVLPVLGQALAPGDLEELGVDNPIGVTALEAPLEAARALGFLCFLTAVLGGALALLARWRRGEPATRRALALPAVAAGVLALTLAVPTDGPLGPWLDALALVEVALLLVCFGIAVLRDQVAGTPLVLRRSLAFGLLTGLLAAGYAAGVAALSQLVDDPAAGLLATVGTALLALPLRDRLQQLVDRAVYGERADPFAALRRLDERVEGAADPQSVLAGVAASVADVLRLPGAEVLVRQDGTDVVAASTGAVRDGVLVPLLHHGEVVGALRVGPRRGQAGLDARDLRMLEALQRQAAAAVASVRLSQELQLSRERLVAAREEERRRLRRDLHDGLGPTLAGIGLGLEVARAAQDPLAVDALLADLKDEAAAAVHDVRRIVEDLRPPALDELGLVGALRRHADRLQAGSVVVDVSTTSDLRALPAAVEVAAYRIAMEALTNAVRHGDPRRCTVALRVDDALHLEVADDGRGLPPRPRDGVGLQAMHERAAELGGTVRVLAREGGGTRVLARIPVHA